MHERVEVPLVTAPRAILVGDKVQVRPIEGETAAARETVPVKPLKAETVIVEVPGEPDKTLTRFGIAAIVKSCTV